jgi:hypothetical protein
VTGDRNVAIHCADHYADWRAGIPSDTVPVESGVEAILLEPGYDAGSRQQVHQLALDPVPAVQQFLPPPAQGVGARAAKPRILA